MSRWRSVSVRDLNLSVAFFDDHEGHVVRLWHALSEFLDPFQELLLERVTSRGCRLPNDFQQSVLLEHFILEVLCVRDAAGIHHQNVSLVQLEHAGLVRGEIKHP